MILNRKCFCFSPFSPRNHCSDNIAYSRGHTRFFVLCKWTLWNSWKFLFSVVWCCWVIPTYTSRGRLENIEIFSRKTCRPVGIMWKLCRLAKIILKNNYFELGSHMYHQLLGIEIGTKFTPNYTNIFMAALEENLFKELKFKAYIWLLYLDDIFCIWTEGLEKLKEFLNFLDEFYPSLKFNMDYSRNSINF